jgi:hypothetical protein
VLRGSRKTSRRCALDERNEFSPLHGCPPAEASGKLRLSHAGAMSVAKQQIWRAMSQIDGVKTFRHKDGMPHPKI